MKQEPLRTGSESSDNGKGMDLHGNVAAHCPIPASKNQHKNHKENLMGVILKD